MGNSASQELPQTQQQTTATSGCGPYEVGEHILTVQPGSPAEAAGLVSYFDFIVAVNSTPLDQDDGRLGSLLQANVNNNTILTVYNAREDTLRQVTVVPSNCWGGTGLLGVNIRFVRLKNANEHVWHVLDVYPSSPAQAAGLEPHTDYIVGTPEVIFDDGEDFFTLINSNMNKPIQLYVYSIRTNSIRQVTITPNRKWGGNGSLGCDVGYGYLHRIPTKNQRREQIIQQGQGETYAPQSHPLQQSTHLPQLSSPAQAMVAPQYQGGAQAAQPALVPRESNIQAHPQTSIQTSGSSHYSAQANTPSPMQATLQSPQSGSVGATTMLQGQVPQSSSPMLEPVGPSLIQPPALSQPTSPLPPVGHPSPAESLPQPSFQQSPSSAPTTLSTPPTTLSTPPTTLSTPPGSASYASVPTSYSASSAPPSSPFTSFATKQFSSSVPQPSLIGDSPVLTSPMNTAVSPPSAAASSPALSLDEKLAALRLKQQQLQQKFQESSPVAQTSQAAPSMESLAQLEETKQKLQQRLKDLQLNSATATARPEQN